MIPDDVIEQVRESADIVGIVGESVDLKRTGADYRGPCPFHEGKNRNFAVFPRTGRYHCFVCHESGDVFSYLMKRFGMDYPTAVRDVARRSGIVVPERAERSGPDPLEKFHTALAAAHEWFARQLVERPDGQAARDYLAGRDFAIETAASLGLGWAPTGRAFQDHMRSLGVADEVLVEAGLVVRREDGSTGPRFRNRLLFPIHDLRGRVVGFGGRLLGPGEPKYLNSPESKVFHKGGMLYNLHQAKQAIRREETVVLVEGYFDVLRLVLAGVEHVVAPLGTALTTEQAALLRRYAPAAILLYDSDGAGQRATFRAGDELLRHGMRVKVATMPEGEDPDTLVRAGGAAVIAPILRDAVDVFERKIRLLERRGWFEDVERRRGAVDRLLPTIRAASDPITRELYLTRAAERAGVGRDVLAREAAAAPRRGAVGSRDGGASQEGPAPTGPGREAARPRIVPPAAERDLLRVLLDHADWRRRARDEVRADWFELRPFREIFDALMAVESGARHDALPDGLSPSGQRAWAWLKASAERLGEVEPDRVYPEACQELEARPNFRRYDALGDEIARAADQETKSSLMGERRQLGEALKARFPEQWVKRFHKKTRRRRPPPAGTDERSRDAS